LEARRGFGVLPGLAAPAEGGIGLRELLVEVRVRLAVRDAVLQESRGFPRPT